MDMNTAQGGGCCWVVFHTTSSWRKGVLMAQRRGSAQLTVGVAPPLVHTKSALGALQKIFSTAESVTFKKNELVRLVPAMPLLSACLDSVLQCCLPPDECRSCNRAIADSNGWPPTGACLQGSLRKGPSREGRFDHTCWSGRSRQSDR